MSGPQWRRMRPGDIPAAHALSRQVHTDHPESEAVLAEKHALFPAGCFALEMEGDGVAGYAFSHPWTNSVLPNVDALLGALPAAPSSYFLHDVTLDAGARGKGHAAAIVPVLLDAARACALPRVMLVAVNGAEVFWARFGFAEIADRGLQAAAREKYGQHALAMARDV